MQLNDGRIKVREKDSLVAQMVKCLPTMQETWVWSLGREDPLEKEWQPTPVFMPGKSRGPRSLVGYSPWGCKELDTTERLHFTLLHDAGFEDIRRQPWVQGYRRPVEGGEGKEKKFFHRSFRQNRSCLHFDWSNKTDYKFMSFRNVCKKKKKLCLWELVTVATGN